MSERGTVYIALGSNVGDRDEFLSSARLAISRLPGTRCTGATLVEETEPIGPVPQGPFLNQMIAVATTLAPEALMQELQQIEKSAGRVRDLRWGPRTLDLDIVAIEGVAISTPHLVVPHPELANRAFWLRELATLRQPAEEPL